MSSFADFNLPEKLNRALARLNFNSPTPIQAATIPVALTGQDILGSAQTGTGKTAAYGIPALTKLLTNEHGSAIIIAPTRELATQIMLSLKEMLSKKSPIATALLIGGEPIKKQFRELDFKPRLIVGTPGRINDHLKRGKLNLANADFLVLDETDRMLDMGFSVQINQIIKHMPKKRQTLLFSATLPKDIIKLADNYLNNPKRIAIGSTTNPIENIKQDFMHVTQADKYSELVKQLELRQGSIIVFVKTKYSAEKMAKRLAHEDKRHCNDLPIDVVPVDFRTNAIHGDLRHSKREQVIKAFREKKHRILVATDVAARGLDISHVAHVINYDLPQSPEDYIHRIGRTARAGAQGEALCLVEPSDKGKLNAINRLINPSAAKSDKPKNKFRAKRRSNNQGKAKNFGKKPFRAKKSNITR